MTNTNHKHTQSFDHKIHPHGAELSLTALNADVSIKGYNSDRLNIIVTYTPKQHKAAPPELVSLGNKFVLTYNESAFDAVKIEAFIPAELLSSVTATTSNGAVILDAFTAKTTTIECFNGSVSATNIDVETLSIMAQNGSLTLHIPRFTNFTDYTYTLGCSNNKLCLQLPTQHDTAYFLSAHAALGFISVNFNDLTFIKNEKDIVEAKSRNYDLSRKKIRLKLESSAAPITIN